MREALTVLFLLISPVAGASSALAQAAPPAGSPAPESPPPQTPDPFQVTPETPALPQTPMLPSRGRDCEREAPVTS